MGFLYPGKKGGFFSASRSYVRRSCEYSLAGDRCGGNPIWEADGPVLRAQLCLSFIVWLTSPLWGGGWDGVGEVYHIGFPLV